MYLINEMGTGTVPARWDVWAATAEDFLRGMVAAEPPTPRPKERTIPRIMSVQALSWVLDYSRSVHSARLVLISIANHCDKYGQNAWPSYSTIAEEARIHRSTVPDVLPELEALGELVIEASAGPRGCNLYSLPKMQVVGISDHITQKRLVGNGESLVGIDDKTGRNPRPEPSLAVQEPSENSKPESLEPQNQPTGAECSQCGEIGVHHCTGPSAARAQRLNKKRRAEENALRKADRAHMARPSTTVYVEHPRPTYQPPRQRVDDGELDADYPRLNRPEPE